MQKSMHKFPMYIMLMCLFGLVIFACARQEADDVKPSQSNGLRVGALDAPTIACGSSTGASINLVVTAGASGAPAGFSVHWMLKSDYDLYGWNKLDPMGNSTSYCGASFSGVPGCSNYNLGANESITITIGDLFDACGASGGCGDLECGEKYVFRVFAHNVPGPGNPGKSDYSSTICCSTLPCGGGGCTYTQGYWKTHGPEGCATGNNTNQWPVTSLTLGTVMYSDAQICSIFNTPSAGNGLITLAHQLIAAKLNIANGADGTAIASTITSADALIGSLVIPPVGSGSLANSATSALTTALTNYNEGATGPGHCE